MQCVDVCQQAQPRIFLRLFVRLVVRNDDAQHAQVVGVRRCLRDVPNADWLPENAWIVSQKGASYLRAAEQLQSAVDFADDRNTTARCHVVPLPTHPDGTAPKSNTQQNSAPAGWG